MDIVELHATGDKIAYGNTFIIVEDGIIKVPPVAAAALIEAGCTSDDPVPPVALADCDDDTLRWFISAHQSAKTPIMDNRQSYTSEQMLTMAQSVAP